MSDFKAIIFDMDGLLVDSEPIWEQAENRMLAARGKTLDPKLRQRLVGTRMDEFLGTIRDELGIEDTVAVMDTEVTDHMIELIPIQVTVKPGAQELVEFVAKQKIPRAIASSSALSIIDTVVRHYGWQDIFTTRVSAAEVPFGKPAPDVYLEAAFRLDIAPEDCLALEDSLNGARAAVAAGMTCYAVPDSMHSSRQSFEGITEHVFESLHEVLSALRNTG